MATINNIRVQREILDASEQKIDIGIVGTYREAELATHEAMFASHKTELAAYNSTYDALISDEITSEQARHDIGQVYRQKKTSNSPKRYEEYYGDVCAARIRHQGNP